MKKIALVLPFFSMAAGCASHYTAEKAGMPYYVFRGQQLECEKIARTEGGYHYPAEDTGRQALVFIAAGLVGSTVYNVARPKLDHNEAYKQCMSERGLDPKG